MWKRDSGPKEPQRVFDDGWRAALIRAESPLQRYEQEILRRLANAEAITSIAAEYSRATMLPPGRVALFCLGLIKNSGEGHIFLYAKQPALYKRQTAIEYIASIREEELLARSAALITWSNSQTVDVLLVLTLPYFYVFHDNPPGPNDAFPQAYVTRLRERRAMGVRMRDIYSAVPHEDKMALKIDFELGTLWLRPPSGQGKGWLSERNHLLSRTCGTF
jgi:hypothetical protein